MTVVPAVWVTTVVVVEDAEMVVMLSRSVGTDEPDSAPTVALVAPVAAAAAAAAAAFDMPADETAALCMAVEDLLERDITEAGAGAATTTASGAPTAIVVLRSAAGC